MKTTVKLLKTNGHILDTIKDLDKILNRTSFLIFHNKTWNEEQAYLGLIPTKGFSEMSNEFQELQEAKTKLFEAETILKELKKKITTKLKKEYSKRN